MPTVTQHAFAAFPLYVPLTVLNSEPRATFNAASKAQAAADLMHAQQRWTNVAPS